MSTANLYRYSPSARPEEKTTTMSAAPGRIEHSDFDAAQNPQPELGIKPCDRRTVIYAGPPKTGSTSIQDFFLKYASSREPETRLPAFDGWDFPPPNNMLCRHFSGFNNDTVEEIVEKRLGQVSSRHYRSAVNHGNHTHMFWACEFIALSVSRFGPQRLTNMFQWLKMMSPTCQDETEFVFHYRTPRVEQLLSSWKQLTAPHHPHRVDMPLREFVCTDDAMDRIAELDLNPLANVKSFRDFGKMSLTRHSPKLGKLKTKRYDSDFRVTLVDMGGVERAGEDVVQTLACEVLGVPCETTEQNNATRVVGLPPVQGGRSNSRPREEGLLTDSQYDRIESLFRDRDCLYRDEFTKDPKITVKYRDSLWRDCPADTSSAEWKRLNNTEYFVSQIREVMECSSFVKGAPQPAEISREAFHIPPQSSFQSFKAVQLMAFFVFLTFIRFRQFKG